MFFLGFDEVFHLRNQSHERALLATLLGIEEDDDLAEVVQEPVFVWLFSSLELADSYWMVGFIAPVAALFVCAGGFCTAEKHLHLRLKFWLVFAFVLTNFHMNKDV